MRVMSVPNSLGISTTLDERAKLSVYLCDRRQRELKVQRWLCRLKLHGRVLVIKEVVLRGVVFGDKGVHGERESKGPNEG